MQGYLCKLSPLQLRNLQEDFRGRRRVNDAPRNAVAPIAHAGIRKRTCMVCRSWIRHAMSVERVMAPQLSVTVPPAASCVVNSEGRANSPQAAFVVHHGPSLSMRACAGPFT